MYVKLPCRKAAKRLAAPRYGGHVGMQVRQRRKSAARPEVGAAEQDGGRRARRHVELGRVRVAELEDL